MFFRKTKVANAVAMTLAGAALTFGAVSTASAGSTTMYNLTTSFGADNSTNITDPSNGGAGPWALSGGTDGWLYGLNGLSGGTDTSIAKWAGTTGLNKTPFGYTGAQLNWGLEITGYDTATVSTFDAFSRYGVYADIDTAQGAWSDTAEVGAAGWRHDLDFGLFRTDQNDALVTLTIDSIITPSAVSNFGFTIFKGMSSNLAYGHHGGWNAGNNAGGITSASLPGGGTTFSVGDVVAYTVGSNPVGTETNLNTIQFYAAANQVYTIVLGGYKVGGWGSTNDGYVLNVTTQAVPVPAAIWLLGSAIAGMGIVGRRRERSVAA